MHPFQLAALGWYLAAAPAPAPATEQTGPWLAVKVLTFTDFDEAEVELGGVKRRAFFVGLSPIRQAVGGKDRQERLRKEAADKLNRNQLFARVVTTRRDGAVGLSVDAFMHHRNDFDHGWDPSAHPYCWSGWGAYNLNAYFLHAGLTKHADDFGRNEVFRRQFEEVAERIEKGSRE